MRGMDSPLTLLCSKPSPCPLLEDCGQRFSSSQLNCIIKNTPYLDWSVFCDSAEGRGRH